MPLNALGNKIAIDLDGTIIDHSQIAHRFLTSKLSYSLSLAKCTSDQLKPLLPPEHYQLVQQEIYGKNSTSTPIMDGCKEVLSTLKKQQWDMYIISRRRPENRRFALEWIEKNLEDIIPSSHVHFVASDQEKIILANQLHVNFLIDNQFKILDLLPPHIKGIYFDQYNQFCNKKTKHIKIANWQEFLSHIKTPPVA